MDIQSLKTDSNFMKGAIVISSRPIKHSIAIVHKNMQTGMWMWSCSHISHDGSPIHDHSSFSSTADVDAWFEMCEISKAVPKTTTTKRSKSL